MKDTTMLFPIPASEVWEKMRELLRYELALMVKQGQNVEYTVPGLVQKPLFKAHEVCKMLQVSRQTLHKWAKEGILKPYKIKSRVFYLWADIEKLVKPIDEVPSD